jgi:hypothetical protein
MDQERQDNLGVHEQDDEVVVVDGTPGSSILLEEEREDTFHTEEAHLGEEDKASCGGTAEGVEQHGGVWVEEDSNLEGLHDACTAEEGRDGERMPWAGEAWAAQQAVLRASILEVSLRLNAAAPRSSNSRLRDAAVEELLEEDRVTMAVGMLLGEEGKDLLKSSLDTASQLLVASLVPVLELAHQGVSQIVECPPSAGP